MEVPPPAGLTFREIEDPFDRFLGRERAEPVQRACARPARTARAGVSSSADASRSQPSGTSSATSSNAASACLASSCSSRRSRSAVRANVCESSRPVARSIAGRPSRRIALRKRRVSAFVGSRRGRSPSERQAASTSGRVTSSSGWISVPRTGAMPPSAARPPPRTSAIRSVSAWSSSVWPSAIRADPSRGLPRPAHAAVVPVPRPRSTPPCRGVPPPAQVERQPVACRQPAHVGGVGGRARAESVVQVKDLELDAEEAPQSHERLEQAHGVWAAGHTHEHRLSGQEHLVFARRRADSLQHTRDRRGGAARRLPHDALDPAPGSAISSSEGRCSALAPDEVEPVHAGTPDDLANERFARVILLDLVVEADRSLESALQRRPRRRAASARRMRSTSATCSLATSFITKEA